jgi:hypothetical protein
MRTRICTYLRRGPKLKNTCTYTGTVRVNININRDIDRPIARPGLGLELFFATKLYINYIIINSTSIIINKISGHGHDHDRYQFLLDEDVDVDDDGYI